MNTHHRLLAVLGILVLVLIASGLLMPAASRGASRPEVTLTPTAFAYLPHIAKAYPPPSADVALLLDISDSMASDTCGAGDYPCIHACDTATNVYNTDCHPFQEVKAAALQFLNSLSPGVDRVAVIPFALQVGYCINPGDVWPDCLASAYDPSNGKNGDRYVPLTRRTELNRPSGRVVQPLGLGRGPFRLHASVINHAGARSRVVTVPVRLRR